MKKSYLIFIAAISLTWMSCVNGQQDPTQEAAREHTDALSRTNVTTITLGVRPFSYDLVSNGKVGAGEDADLFFTPSGAVVSRVMVRNGQRVRKGQALAILDRFKLENAVATAKNSLERARLDLADALIGQGYDPEKMAEIPDEVVKLARLRSGVAQAEVQLREAERALDDATLRAPFDGIIANLTQKAGNIPDGSKPFCRVMSTGGMEVVFPILESELALVHAGDAVEVTSFTSGDTYHGRITSINPVVDKNGMVEVCASVGGPTGLYDGMNVRVSVKREVDKALIVPKSAVVLRSNGRQVVFTNKGGKAIWNYVATGLENMSEYVITEGLKEGDEVIVSGNINLAHEAPVKVIND